MLTTKPSFKEETNNEQLKIAYVESADINSKDNVRLIKKTEALDIVRRNRVSFIELDKDTKTYRAPRDEFPGENSRLNITNVFSSISGRKVPLIYKYKLKTPLRRDVNIQRQVAIYSSLTNEKTVAGDIEFSLRYLSRDDGLNDVYVFMNNINKQYEQFYVVYVNSEGQTIEETIYPEFAYYPRHENYMGSSPLGDFEYVLRKDGNYFELEINTPILSQEFFVDFIGYRKIEITDVPYKDRNQRWIAEINNGSFEIDNVKHNRLSFVYSLKEFEREFFDILGPPYKRVTEEPKTIKNELLVQHKLIQDKRPIIVKINRDEVYTNNDFLGLDKINGVIKLPRTLSPHDKVSVEYTAIIETIEYDGYFDVNSRKKLEFNLNPCSGNNFSYLTKMGDFKQVPVFQLMKNPIYLYLKPTHVYYCDTMINDEKVYYKDIDESEYISVSSSVEYVRVRIENEALTNGFSEMITFLDNQPVQKGSNNDLVDNVPFWTFDNENSVKNSYIRIYNPKLLNNHDVYITYLNSDELRLASINEDYTIFHTIEKYTKEECSKDGLVLLAEFFPYPSSTIDDLIVYDLRELGGGVVEELEDEVRELIEPESRFYWDIGFMDGEETGGKVLCVRIDPRVLKENGGHVTKEEIERSIEKHIDAGASYVVEYLSIDDHMEV